MYFLLSHVVQRFHLLKYGLAIILTFIGVKMLGERWFTVPIVASLLVVLLTLAASIVASLLWPAREPPRMSGGSSIVDPEGR
jgi:tellurite resistance protein TerC